MRLHDGAGVGSSAPCGRTRGISGVGQGSFCSLGCLGLARATDRAGSEQGIGSQPPPVHHHGERLRDDREHEDAGERREAEHLAHRRTWSE